MTSCILTVTWLLLSMLLLIVKESRLYTAPPCTQITGAESMLIGV